MFIKIISLIIYLPSLLLISFFCFELYFLEKELKCNHINVKCLEEYYAYRWDVKSFVQTMSVKFKRDFLNIHSFGNVYFAEDEWLFYVTKDDGDIVSDYIGKPLSENMNALWETYINDYFEDISEVWGAPELYMIIAPNKSTFYSEKLKHYSFREETSYAYSSLRKRLQNKAYRKQILFPDEVVSNIKSDSELLYLRTDTHWNLLGAAKSYNVLAKSNSMGLIDLKRIKKFSQASSEGDLYKMLNMKNEFLFNIKEQLSYEKVPCEGDGCSLINKKVLVVGDSFRVAFAEALKIKYREVKNVHFENFCDDKEKYVAFKPDIIFAVKVERTLRLTPASEVLCN